ncbi:hypothetical protein LR69_01987 [Geobacillus sp. BCO2]|nr:hypothetical protein LR69_01987 [Geobacillus sp. BCO2]
MKSSFTFNTFLKSFNYSRREEPLFSAPSSPRREAISSDTHCPPKSWFRFMLFIEQKRPVFSPVHWKVIEPCMVISNSPKCDTLNNIAIFLKQSKNLPIPFCLLFDHFVRRDSQIGSTIVKFKHGYIEFRNMKNNTKGRISFNGRTNFIKRRASQAPMRLHPDAMNRNAFVTQRFDKCKIFSRFSGKHSL